MNQEENHKTFHKFYGIINSVFRTFKMTCPEKQEPQSQKIHSGSKFFFRTYEIINVILVNGSKFIILGEGKIQKLAPTYELMVFNIFSFHYSSFCIFSACHDVLTNLNGDDVHQTTLREIKDLKQLHYPVGQPTQNICDCRNQM